MTSLSMCRICLAKNIRLHEIAGTAFQTVFEKLTSFAMASDKKPSFVCYICFSHLKRCCVMMNKAERAEELLNRLLSCGGVMTESSILDPDLKRYNLKSTLCISPIELITVIETEEEGQEASVYFDDKICVKEELKDVNDQEAKEDKFKAFQSDTEIAEWANRLSSSDSEDDIPLKNISVKKEKEVKAVKVRKRREKGFTEDYAREIVLTHEQQMSQLLSRAKSLNYTNAPMKCELCYRGFTDPRAFRNHTGKHHEKSGPYECDVCHLRYKTLRQLKNHAATSHTRHYECHKCSHLAHTANQAREHQKWHDGHTYECKLCGQKYRKITSYLTHCRKQHPSRHVCVTCGDAFISSHGLAMHTIKSHHSEDQRSIETDQPSSERLCVECNIQFINVDAWKRHMLTSHKYPVKKNDSYNCRICSFRSPLPTAVANHLKQHERELKERRETREIRVTAVKETAQMSCEQCGSKFVNRFKLSAHVKRMHLGLKYNKNIVCEVCGKKCVSNASLVYHQRTHTGERPYQCVYCPRRFTDSNQLRVHTRVHTGEKPYCCPTCGKTFAQKPALNRHYRVHTGVKPYVCQYCSKSFSQTNSLKLHVKTVHLKMPSNRKNKQQDAEKNESALKCVIAI